MHLKILGLNHTTAPIEVREKFSVGKEALRRGLEHLDDYDGLSEAVILSTCNRSEIYAVTAADCEASVYQFLSDLIGGAVDKNLLYEFDDEACAEHLFEVAAGLDSLILGEGQILSQVKEAYSIAKAAQATNTILNTLFHRAIAAGKRVRTETKIAYNSVSVSSAAVELAAKKLGGLEGRSALIFGAGKMAQLTAQHLLAHGVGKIFVANHHLERAEAMAAKIGGEAVAWEEAFTGAAHVDIIITSTGAPHYVVKPWQTQQLMTRRQGRGIFFIDIAVPRDVDPEVGKIKGVTLYNIDDLESVVEKNLQARQREALLAKKIVAEDAAAVMERFKYLKFQPLMANLSERAEQIRLRELRRAAGKLSNLSDDERRILEQMTRRIVRKLLRMPMMNLNASAGTDAENFYAQAWKAMWNEELGMILRKIKIGTRASRLALWQAEFVAAELKKFFPTLEIELVKVRTTGDKILDAPLAKIGGKGLFTKELELQMAAGAIDLAVHSLKDVPTELPAGFRIAAITRRAQPFDAFVSNRFATFDALPKNSVVGTSSLRRAAQILALRPDLQIKNLRGNVETRLKKLDAGEFDAIILAAAGLERLGHSARIGELLTEIIPAAGQGALAIETRADDDEIFQLVQKLNDAETCAAVEVEREFLREVGGSCQIPVGVFAAIDGEQIKIRTLIASTDGQRVVKASEVAPLEQLDGLGKKIAARLLGGGGNEILNTLTT